MTSEARLMSSGVREDILSFFADNVLQDRDRTKIRTPSCFSRRDASKYVFVDPESSSSKFQLGSRDLKAKCYQSKSKYISIDASSRAKHDATMGAAVFLFCKMLLTKKRISFIYVIHMKNAHVLTPNTETREKNAFYLTFVLSHTIHKEVF